MAPPKTYRNRLIFYITLLEIFLISVLFFYYSQSRDALFDAANRSTDLFVSQIDAKIRLQARELEQSARLIGDNVQLREYMFIVVNVGAETAPLNDLFQRQFGWLPYHSAAIISKNGEVLIGSFDMKFYSEVEKYKSAEKWGGQIFYFATDTNIEMAAFVPVLYQNQFLGYVVLTRIVDTGLIEAAQSIGYGQFFIVKNGKILRSSLEQDYSGRPFRGSRGHVRLGEDDFQVRRIVFGPVQSGLPEIWFGFSSPELTARIVKNRDQMLVLGFAGSVAILIIGIFLVRNFDRPISRLVRVMEHVGDGRFPQVEESTSNDEIGYLHDKFHEMVSRLKEKQDEVDRVHTQLEEQATTDVLTGFYNRRHLYDLYPKLLSDAKRQGKTITVILADLDLFKEVNDRHGHVTGDKVLAHVSDVMRKCCRVSDFIFRIGGEEFLVLTTGGIKGGETLANKIRERIENTPVSLDDKTLYVTSSFGVAQHEPDDGDRDLTAVLSRADKALYAAKDAGRNCVSSLDISSIHTNKWRV